MECSDEETSIVLERLRVMPKTIRLNIGTYGSFDRDELIGEVSERSEIGKLVVGMQMAYLRSFKERMK